MVSDIIDFGENNFNVENMFSGGPSKNMFFVYYEKYVYLIFCTRKFSFLLGHYRYLSRSS